MLGVFDNNVIISGLLLDGMPRIAFDKMIDNGTILVSAPLLMELAEVLGREKFDKYVSIEERMDFLVGFLKVAQMVEISEKITVCRDPKDNKMLELAVCGEADILISGDKDLLVLNPFRGVEIITPREFVDKPLS